MQMSGIGPLTGWHVWRSDLYKKIIVTDILLPPPNVSQFSYKTEDGAVRIRVRAGLGRDYRTQLEAIEAGQQWANDLGYELEIIRNRDLLKELPKD